MHVQVWWIASACLVTSAWTVSIMLAVADQAGSALVSSSWSHLVVIAAATATLLLALWAKTLAPFDRFERGVDEGERRAANRKFGRRAGDMHAVPNPRR